MAALQEMGQYVIAEIDGRDGQGPRAALYHLQGMQGRDIPDDEQPVQVVVLPNQLLVG